MKTNKAVLFFLITATHAFSNHAFADVGGVGGGVVQRQTFSFGSRTLATADTVNPLPSIIPSPSPTQSTTCTTPTYTSCPAPLTAKFECPLQWAHGSDGRVWCLHDAYHMGSTGLNSLGEQFANNLLVCDYERLNTTYVGPDPIHPIAPMDRIATADCSGMTRPFGGSAAISTAGGAGTWCQSTTGHLTSGAPVYLSLPRSTTATPYVAPSPVSSNNPCPPAVQPNSCPPPITTPDVCPLQWSTESGYYPTFTWCLHDTYRMGSTGLNGLGEQFSPNLLVCDYERLNTTAIGPDPIHPTSGMDRIASAMCSHMDLPFGGSSAGITSGGAGTWCQSYSGHLPNGAPVYLSLPADTSGGGTGSTPAAQPSGFAISGNASSDVKTYYDAGTVAANTKTAVAGPVLATQLALSGTFSCALTASQEMKCWGNEPISKSLNNLAIGSNMNLGTSITSMSAGLDYLVYMSGGRQYGFGQNNMNQLDGASFSTSGKVSNITQLSAGNFFTCGLSQGLIYCWGTENHGGMGGATDSTFIKNIGTASAVSVGAESACAIMAADGTVYCWGRNSYGQVNPTISGQTWPSPGDTNSQVPGLSNVTAVASGHSHRCALMNGRVYCWGLNDKGQLGGSSINPLVPVPNLTGVTQIASNGSGYFTCAVAKQLVYCWGSDNTGQIDNTLPGGQLGGSSISSNLTPVAGVRGAVSVYVGNQHACAIAEGGYSVFCWGLYSSSQTGNPSSPAVTRVKFY